MLTLLTATGSTGMSSMLITLVLMLAKEGVMVLGGSVEEGAVSVKVAPEQLFPTLLLIHTHIFG